MEPSVQSPRFFSRSTLLPVLVLVSATILSYLALIQPWSLRQTSLPLAVGDVASQDLRAPHEIQFVSKVLTDAARDDSLPFDKDTGYRLDRITGCLSVRLGQFGAVETVRHHER